MKMAFIGDLMCTKETLEMYRLDKTKYDFDDAFQYIKNDFSDVDYVIANLETPIAGFENSGYTNENYTFNTPETFLDALLKSGINVLQTSNNHCLDRGIVGLEHTIKEVRKRGFINLGTRININEKRYEILSDGDFKVGLVAYTYGTNAFINMNYLDNNNCYRVNMLQKQELSNVFVRYLYKSRFILVRLVRYFLREILRIPNLRCPVYERRENCKNEMRMFEDDIKECKENCNYLIALLHIGGQYNLEPTDYSKEVMRRCKLLGVNAVFSNHEHVIQNISSECVPGFFGEYSMGNFYSTTGVVSPPMDKMSNYSVVYLLDLDANRLSKISIRLYCNHLNGEGKLVVESLYSYYKKCEIEKRNIIYKEIQLVLNRLFNTNNEEYSIEKEYLLYEEDRNE